MKRIYFFATKGDISSITAEVEKQFPLKYVLAHHDLFPEYSDRAPWYESAIQIPTLGIATRKQTTSCERYIAMDRSTQIEPVARLIGGVSRIAFELGNCEDCIELTSGGFWNEDVLISGLVQTWSEGASAQRLMRKFSSLMKKIFSQKSGVYWIGPEAFEFLKNGGRLTLNLDAPSAMDIKVEHVKIL